MENLSLEEFTQWARDPVTMKVRDYLLELRERMNVDQSSVLDKAVLGDMPSLETIALDSVMRAATIQGIDAFTDFDRLAEDLFPKEVANV